MAREEELGYDSAPGTPTSLDGEKKKKKGFKKLLSLTSKKASNSDKSPSASGRFEQLLQKDAGEGSRSRRRGLTAIFKRSPTSKEDQTSINQNKTELVQETNNDKPKPAEKQNFSDEKELDAKKRNEVSKKETEAISKAAEAIGEGPKPVSSDDKPKSKEHQGSEAVVIVGHNEEKKVIENEHKHQHEQKQIEEGDSKDAESVGASETVNRDFGSPPPPPVVQEKEEVGCESLAKGLQKVCLPWTVNKDDH